MSADPRLDRLLQHPAIWRGRSAARTGVVPSGFDALDECLPGGGWPQLGLVEILVSRLGVGELYLILPALAWLTRQSSARWCTWVAPPFEPFAPALSAHGVAIDHVLVVRTQEPLWAYEQALGSGACDIALTWMRRAHPRDIRRLQLATERGRTLGIVFRTLRAARESSSAALRIALEPMECGARVTLLKSRGGSRGPVELRWPPDAG